MKNAVACEHDPVFHKGCSASPKHNDSSDLARSSTKKFQIHIALPFTAIFTLPSLHMCSSLCPSFQQRSQVDQCWAAAASSVFLDFPPSENIKPRLFHRDNSLVKAWPLLVVRASSHQGQHQLFATQPLHASCSGRHCHCIDNSFQKQKSTPLRSREPPVINWHRSIKLMLSYTICNPKSILLCT